MTDWPCHVWLQKKIVLPTNKAALGCVTDFYAPIWKMGLCVLYHQTKMFTHRENDIYQQWTTYSLKSKSVSKMHFPGIWRSKFTDLAKKKTVKKLNLWEKKNSLETKCLDKSLPICGWIILVFLAVSFWLILNSPYFKKNYCDMHTMVLIMDFVISNDWRKILKNCFYHIIHVFTKVEKPSIVYYCAVLLVVVIQFCLISFDSCLLISIVYFLMKQLLLNLFLWFYHDLLLWLH